MARSRASKTTVGEHLRALEVRDLVLARAIEEADTRGDLVALADRRRVTREARAVTEAEKPFLAHRARLVLAELEGHEPDLARARRVSGALWPPLWTVAVGLFVLGVLFDRIGAGRRVHVLAFPVVGLLVWNVGVYVGLLLAAWRAAGAARERDLDEDRAPEHEQRPPLLARWVARLRDAASALRRGPGGAERPGLASALARFFRDWLEISAPLQWARLQRLLHVGACTFALGVIASLYLRGLVLEYEASWESTFLTPDAARALLAIFLAPASWVLGLEIPSAEHLERIREQPESAAGWIHLWAASVALFVVLPRALLATAAHLRSRRYERALPFPWQHDPYCLRLSAPERGGGASALVAPYSYTPSARARERLKELLLELFGNRATVRLREPLAYGEGLDLEASTAVDVLPDEGCLVLVFNLAQSPEQEVHGRLVEALRRGVEGAGGVVALLVCVDESVYVARLGSGQDAEQRVEERRRSWRRLLREVGVRAVFLRLEDLPAGEGLEAARGGLYPERALQGVR